MDTRQFGLHINSHKDLHLVREILLINQVKSSLLYKHTHFCSYIDGMPKTWRNQGGMQVSFGRHFGCQKYTCRAGIKKKTHPPSVMYIRICLPQISLQANLCCFCVGFQLVMTTNHHKHMKMVNFVCFLSECCRKKSKATVHQRSLAFSKTFARMSSVVVVILQH